MSQSRRNADSRRTAHGRARAILFFGALILGGGLTSLPAFGQGPGGGGPGGGGPGGGGPPPLNPLPPVPVPAGNPLTPAKAILGKFLFWEEQLSSDQTIACGSCHLPEFGGADPRATDSGAIHPGFDGLFGSADDVAGSPGVAAQDCDQNYFEHPSFGSEVQSTNRRAQTTIMAAYATRLFWDGRAEPQFLDPETGQVVLNNRGGLESQALGPILSAVEMACDSRTWGDVITQLESATPLGLAESLTPDLQAALVANPTYPELFQAAFGTTEITPVRIAFAIASYERTLIANQTPFDTFITQGPPALTPQQNQGVQVFGQNCAVCHSGALTSDNQFHNIGVRPSFEDPGRQGVTGNPQDAGRFKTPSLRNVALRAPYFHNGSKATLAEVIEHYNQGGEFDDNLDPAVQPLGLSQGQKNALEAFLTTVLTDPRVAQGQAPFDRPTLRPHFRRGDSNADNQLDIGDSVRVLDTLFLGAAELPCRDAADANDDGQIDVGDVISILDRIFSGGLPLPAPSDTRRGPDPSPDALDCDFAQM